MASKGKTLIYLLGIIMAILVNHGCVAEILDLSEIVDLQFSYSDVPEHHIRRRSTVDPALYLMVLEVNISSIEALNNIRSSVASVVTGLPLQMDNSTEITAVEISTVCSLNETQYQCKCEDMFVWPNDTCLLYEACDVITNGSCTCINGLPDDGQFCQDVNRCLVSPSVCGPNSNCTNEIGSYSCSCLNGFFATNFSLPVSIDNICTAQPPTTSPSTTTGLFEYESEIDISFSDSAMVNSLRNLITIIPWPYALSSVKIIDVQMTTVCGLNGTEYDCQCEQEHVWPSDTCRAYQVCDGIVGGTCGCIQALPSAGPLCQKDINECLPSPSVCGPNSNCINEIGSYNCSCLDGFLPTSTNQFVSINNTCRALSSSTPSPSPSTSTLSPSTTTREPLFEYETEIDISLFISYPISSLRSLVKGIPLPYSLNSIKLLDVDMTTVCGLNGTEYDCQCEQDHVWPRDTCSAYRVCDAIVGGTCGCIQALPSTGSLCQKDINECQLSPSVCGPYSNCTNEIGSHSCLCFNGFTAANSNLLVSINNTCIASPPTQAPPTPAPPPPPPPSPTTVFEFESEIDISLFIPYSMISLRSVITAIPLPYTLSDINLLDVDMTTVCDLNGTNYDCQCEQNHVWSSDTCRAYQVCDTIVGGTCGCIQALPSEGPLCKRDVNECGLTPSVCGPYSNCTNEIGSYSCKCLNGFVSINNICTAETVSTPSTIGPSPPTSEPSTTTTMSTPTSTSALTPTPTPTPTPTSTSTSTSTSTLTSTEQLSTSTPAPSTTAEIMTPVPPPPPPPPTTTTAKIVIGMSMKINQPFDTSLADPKNQNAIDLSGTLNTSIDSSYSTHLTGYISKSAHTTAFRPGSVLADYTISATSSSLDFAAANTALTSSLKALGIVLADDAFAQSEQKDFTTAQSYPLQKLDLTCTQPDFAIGQIKWTVNNRDPALDSSYSLSNNNSTLTVKNASEIDSGRYSCIIQRSTIPYIQWQNIAIKQRPTIIVGNNYRVLPCDGSSVLLKCSVDAGYTVEWVLGETVQMSESGPDGITLNHTTQNGNCSELQTFTCRLKGLPQLLAYSYSQSSVTVQKKEGAFDCQNEELGIGNLNDERSGVCRNGFKGIITYRCQVIDVKNVWSQVKENCVLEVIDQLFNQVQILQVEQIPAFMANLSFATENNNINITNSPATVKAIVDILFKIADLSQTTLIGQTVMNSFLNTVDIIVSSNASDTWNKLNSDNTTTNTNVRLLNATENISDRLTDEFTINQTSIQLSRTTVNNLLSVTSTLPNSTTQIVIPQISQPTTVTIIIFTTLDNILPTRDVANYNSSGKSDVRINGDVVVVKVNETVNNISFAFDITNQTLGNPQCVFWNFNLDAWDSTGCKVKPVGNETGIITCECNHTTAFSVLMSPFVIDSLALAYITYIGVAISIASLILCLIIEAIVWKSVTATRSGRNETSYMRHVSIVNIAVSLIIANVCFIIAAAISDQEQPTSVGRCSPVVFFMHFFYLALFFWMLISALLLLYITVMVFAQMSKVKMMLISFIVGYGAPLLIAVITVASTAGPKNYVSRQACWLNWDESKALLAFVIPALTIVAINLVVLIVVLCKMLRRGVGATTPPDEKHTLFVVMRCVAFLTPLFGLTWGFGIGTMVSRELGVHVVFTLLNSFQGFFILLFGTLLDSKVREALRGKLMLDKLASSLTKSTSGGVSSSAAQRRRNNVYNVSDPNSSRFTSEGTSGSYAGLNT